MILSTTILMAQGRERDFGVPLCGGIEEILTPKATLKMPHKVHLSRSSCALINNLPAMLGCGIIFDSVSHPENQGTVPHLSCKGVVFARECTQNDF